MYAKLVFLEDIVYIGEFAWAILVVTLHCGVGHICLFAMSHMRTGALPLWLHFSVLWVQVQAYFHHVV